MKSKLETDKIHFYQLFQYSSVLEKCLLITGLIFTLAGSLGFPAYIWVYGEGFTLLVERVAPVDFRPSLSSPILATFGGGKILPPHSSTEDLMNELKNDTLAHLYATIVIGVVDIILLAIGIYLIHFSILRQVGTMRKLYFESLLRQDTSWYDTALDINFTSKLTEDLDKIKEAIGEKFSIFCYQSGIFIIGIIMSLYVAWECGLIAIAAYPFSIVATVLIARNQSKLNLEEISAYSKAGAVVEEVLESIRTVVTFSGTKKEIQRYHEHLIPTVTMATKKGLFTGIGNMILWVIIYIFYGVTMWYGTVRIIQDRNAEDPAYTPNIVMTIVWYSCIGAVNVGFGITQIGTFSAACTAAENIYSVIGLESRIDPLTATGSKLNQVAGKIHFKNITFQYPSRKDITILKGFNLTIKSGETVAFVGPSGNGKSTVLQLLQRLYDPAEGTVEVDGSDIRKFNISWFRSQIGVVGQEPVLFADTIGNNIRFGKPSATNEEVVEAARTANCHDFISKLPLNYNTRIGAAGGLSGGQKQRIAIARALISDPKILILDEATSALDTTSEKKVQEALDKASSSRTTLIVSHRLSTITNADRIVFVEKGRITEEGTHTELMAKKGQYYKLTLTHKMQEDQSTQISQKEDEKANPNESIKEEDHSNNPIETDQEFNLSLIDLLKMYKPEWKLIICGSFAAFINGCTFPMWGVLFSIFCILLTNPDTEYVEYQAILTGVYLAVLGLVVGTASMLQHYSFTSAGARMTHRLRVETFSSILTQEMGWFDRKENSVGNLSSRLSGDCATVQGATICIGSMLQALGCLLAGTIAAFIYSWQLTLLVFLVVPILVGSVILEAHFLKKSASDEKKAVENASSIAFEAIGFLTTVNSLCREREVLEKFSAEVDKATKACQKGIRFRGLVFGFGQGIVFIAYGICFAFGGYLVASYGHDYVIITALAAILIWGAYVLAQAIASASLLNIAILSASRLQTIINRVPEMSLWGNATSDNIQGDVEYKNIDFRYPTRKNVPVLRGLNLSIRQGQTVALVGPSGCGKSTCIELLLRHYDPNSGVINLNRLETTAFGLDSLRSQLGLVSQKPVLFDRTIAENISYGDNHRDHIPMIEIIEAAKMANIHDFIMSLPQGYETPLGSRASQLSGGQRQRIAIARALIRNPKILILDEATSALDNESEKIVQEALNNVSKGRTCITIAHRLTTIQNADLICVLSNGVVKEMGTHQELLGFGGIYKQMYEMQGIH